MAQPRLGRVLEAKCSEQSRSQESRVEGYRLPGLRETEVGVWLFNAFPTLLVPPYPPNRARRRPQTAE
jgi:hypothetical protein